MLQHPQPKNHEFKRIVMGVEQTGKMTANDQGVFTSKSPETTPSDDTVDQDRKPTLDLLNSDAVMSRIKDLWDTDRAKLQAEINAAFAELACFRGNGEGAIEDTLEDLGRCFSGARLFDTPGEMVMKYRAAAHAAETMAERRCG